eukprot:8434377-Alexandrium_andersonii.AAC.1
MAANSPRPSSMAARGASWTWYTSRGAWQRDCQVILSPPAAPAGSRAFDKRARNLFRMGMPGGAAAASR